MPLSRSNTLCIDLCVSGAWAPLPSRLEDAIRQQLKINYFDTLICVCGFVTYEVVSIQSIIDQFRRHRRKHAAYTPVLARGHVSARDLYPAAHSGLRRTNCRLSEDPYAVFGRCPATHLESCYGRSGRPHRSQAKLKDYRRPAARPDRFPH